MKDGAKTPGKVAVYATCYVNYNEPGIGHDLLKVLAHNEIPYRLVDKEKCCGMPKLELGDLEGVDKLKQANIPALARYAREGWAILSAVPSCTLMFKQELPLMYPDDADVQAVKEAMWDPFRPAEDRLQAAAGQGELVTPATAACRTSARRPRRCSSWCGTRWPCTWSAAPATPAPTA